MTTRFDRNTASWIECVTNTTVSFFSRHSVEQVGVELVARDLVERAEGLVHQQQVGLRDQAARDRHAHLHAARQLARQGLGELRQAHQRQRVGDARVGLARAARRPGRAAAARWPARWPTASAWAPGTRRPCAGRVASSCADRLAPQQQPAVGGLEQAGHHLQQRALAAARGPEQRDELALGAPSGPPAAARACRWDRSSPTPRTSMAGASCTHAAPPDGRAPVHLHQVLAGRDRCVARRVGGAHAHARAARSKPRRRGRRRTRSTSGRGRSAG